MVASEPVPTSTRLLAVVTGTVGLLTVGIMLVSFTPDGADRPIAAGSAPLPAIDLTAVTDVSTTFDTVVSTTTSFAARRAPVRASGLTMVPYASVTTATTTGTVTTPTTEPSPAVPATSVQDLTTTSSPAPTSSTTLTGDGPFALATPIGDGLHALVTSKAAGESDPIDVELPSGRIVSVPIVARYGDTVVIVALADAEPPHELADRRPGDDEFVTVMATPPVTLAFADIATLSFGEGTAVLDDDGDLVGLCSLTSGITTVIELDDIEFGEDGGLVTDDPDATTTSVTTSHPNGSSTTAAP